MALGTNARIQLAMDRLFAEPKTPDERHIKTLIDAYVEQEKTRLEPNQVNETPKSTT